MAADSKMALEPFARFYLAEPVTGGPFQMGDEHIAMLGPKAPWTDGALTLGDFRRAREAYDALEARGGVVVPREADPSEWQKAGVAAPSQDRGVGVKAAVDAAAIKWCGDKERETSLDDVRYFEANWRALPGLRAYVERELGRPVFEDPAPAPAAGVEEAAHALLNDLWNKGGYGGGQYEHAIQRRRFEAVYPKAAALEEALRALPTQAEPVAAVKCHHCSGIGGFAVAAEDPEKGGGMDSCPWCRGSGVDPDQAVAESGEGEAVAWDVLTLEGELTQTYRDEKRAREHIAMPMHRGNRVLRPLFTHPAPAPDEARAEILS